MFGNMQGFFFMVDVRHTCTVTFYAHVILSAGSRVSGNCTGKEGSPTAAGTQETIIDGTASGVPIN